MIDELGISGFVLKQSQDYLKLGTDAMLLSHFARVTKNALVCDLGTGNGAISILMAARHPHIHIDAIEILRGPAALAKENVLLNHLSNRMHVVEGDIRHIETYFSAERYDCVVSNPPYLSKNGGLHTDNPNLLAARMEIDSTIDDICTAAKFLLKYGGNFSIVYRPERLHVLFAALSKNNLEPKRLRFVQNKLSTAPSLVLVEARKGGNPGLSVLPVLLIRSEDGRESKELLDIYQKTPRTNV